MISQHTIKSNPGARRRERRIGRGSGSGRGTFSGRGHKGQTARTGSSKRPGFEGGQTPLIRRLPKLKGFSNVNKVSYQAFNVEDLNKFEDNETVDIVALYERKIISRKNRPVKVLGNGELTKKLTLKVDACSATALKKIEDKGGKVILPEKKPAPTKVVKPETILPVASAL